MTEYKIDPVTWFSERKLAFTPAHFTVSNTTLTPESSQWILNNLSGRFSIVPDETTVGGIMFLPFFGYPAFEDPREAVIYELTWS